MSSLRRAASRHNTTRTSTAVSKLTRCFVLVSFPLLKTTHAHRTRTTTKKTAPEASMNDLRPNQTSLRDGLIWEPSALSGEEVDNYLIMTRGLVIQTSHTRDRHEPRWRRPGVSSTGVLLTADQEATGTAVAAAGGGTGDIIPLEADEQALFYLYQQNYKLDMTFLRLISELGMQKGAHCYCYTRTCFQLSCTYPTLAHLTQYFSPQLTALFFWSTLLSTPNRAQVSARA